MRTIVTMILVSIMTHASMSPDGMAAETSTVLLKNRDDNLRFFVVDKHSTSIYASRQGPILDNVALRLGEVVFANDESETQVSIGRYHPWSKIGWVAKHDLLEGVSEPMTLGQLKALAPQLGFDRAPAVSSSVGGRPLRSDALFLRALTHPERQTTLGSFPGDRSGKLLETWGWHYVFDIEVRNNLPWILLGKAPALFGLERRPLTSQDRRATVNLVGWVSLEEVSLWATNMAVELNMDPTAVAHRARENAPAKIFKTRTTSDANWIEPLHLLYEDDGKPKSKEVRLDPIGLAPEYPRVLVLDRDDAYVKVATGVSTTGTITHGEIAQARAQKHNMRELARAVDIVFLVDQSVSMKDEIANVKVLLTDIAKQLNRVVLEDLIAGDPLIHLDVIVSVIGFDNQLHVHLARASLRQMRKIQGALNRLHASGSSGEERIHDALVQVLKRNYLGGETMRRFIVLLTDEPGVTPPEHQERVLAACPTFRIIYSKQPRKWAGPLATGPLENGDSTALKYFRCLPPPATGLSPEQLVIAETSPQQDVTYGF